MYRLDTLIKSFSSAVQDYEHYAEFQNCVASEVAKLFISYFKRKGKVLDLGVGTAFVQDYLKNSFEVVALDVALAMLQYSRVKHPHLIGVCADADRIPFRKGSFSAIVSSLMMQWSQDLSILLKNLSNLLDNEGLLVFSILGEKSLHELRASWERVDDKPHVHSFLSKEKLEWMLCKLFSDVKIIENNYCEYFPTVLSMMRHLNRVGVSNQRVERRGGLQGKKRLANMMVAYESYYVAEKGFPLTYQVFYVVAKK